MEFNLPSTIFQPGFYPLPAVGGALKLMKDAGTHNLIVQPAAGTGRLEDAKLTLIDPIADPGAGA